MLRSMRETIRLNKRAIGIWWRESPGMLVSLLFLCGYRCAASLCGNLFFCTDHYGAVRREKSGYSAESGIAVTWNGKCGRTPLSLF